MRDMVNMIQEVKSHRKHPHKGAGAALVQHPPESGAAVAARLLRRNRPTEAVQTTAPEKSHHFCAGAS